MKKKILYIVTKSNFGGAQRYVFDMATSCAAMPEFDVFVVVGEWGELARRLEEAGVRVSSLSRLGRDVSPVRDVASFAWIFRIIRRERPDIIHCNSSKAGFLGAIAGRMAGVPKIIFTAHGWAFTERRNFFQRKAILFLQWTSVLASHGTIAVSEHTAREAAHFPFVSKKLRVIHNGVDAAEHEDRAAVRAAFSREHGISPDSAWVGVLAELHPNKGVINAVGAFAHLVKKSGNMRASLVVIGDGDEREKLEELVREEGAENYVHFIGYRKNAARYLGAFDVFLLPSVKEGFPLALLEAGHARLPVVASAVGGIPELIEDGATGLLVRPGDAEQLAEVLGEMLDNREKRNIFASALHKKVTSEFTKDRMIEKTLPLYA